MSQSVYLGSSGALTERTAIERKSIQENEVTVADGSEKGNFGKVIEEVDVTLISLRINFSEEEVF